MRYHSAHRLFFIKNNLCNSAYYILLRVKTCKTGLASFWQEVPAHGSILCHPDAGGIEGSRDHFHPRASAPVSGTAWRRLTVGLPLSLYRPAPARGLGAGLSACREFHPWQTHLPYSGRQCLFLRGNAGTS